MTQKQQKALQCLLTQPTKKAAAQAAGITENTLRAYMAEEEFQEEYRHAFSMMITDATHQAQQALSPAISALTEIVQDKDESSSARISAARSILEYGLRMTEFNDILRTLDAMGDQYVL